MFAVRFKNPTEPTRRKLSKQHCEVILHLFQNTILRFARIRTMIRPETKRSSTPLMKKVAILGVMESHPAKAIGKRCCVCYETCHSKVNTYGNA